MTKHVDYTVEGVKRNSRLNALVAFCLGITCGAGAMELSMHEQMATQQLTFDENVAKLTKREQLCIIEQGKEVHQFPCKTLAQDTLRAVWIR